jgi:hypothetical protein
MPSHIPLASDENLLVMYARLGSANNQVGGPTASRLPAIWV